MFDRVLSAALYMLSNSFILHITSSMIAHLIWEQDVGDDLGVWALNFLPEISALPSLVAISLVKVEI